MLNSLLLLLSARMGSLNAMETAFRTRNAWRGWLGGALPSADRLGEVAAQLNAEEFRRVLLKHHGRRKRKKTLPALPGGWRVLILDGHEMWTSYRRRCEGCCARQVQHKDETREQYYLRYVAAYLMGQSGRLLLDLELQRPGEGEIAAAKRLLARLLTTCPRAFNVVAGDALYLDPALCTMVLEHRKDFIAVLKNENRGLIEDFRGLVPLEAPVEFTFNKKQCACRDIEGFNSWPQLGRPVRVVQSLEHSTVRRQLTDEIEEQTTEWLWATSLPKAKVSTQTVVRIGHGRWSIENQGFNELVNHWRADHVYHLHTNAITVILLLLFLVYNLFHVWVQRGIKPQLLQRHNPLYFSNCLKADLHAPMNRSG